MILSQISLYGYKSRRILTGFGYNDHLCKNNIKKEHQVIQYFGTIADDLCLNTLVSAQEAQDLNIEIHQSLDSTNTRLRHILESMDLTSSEYGLVQLVCSDEQTAGRGRMQRKWLSPPGQNTYTSFAFHFPGDLDLSGLSLAVGLSLRRVLVQQTGLDIHVKWPNDVVTSQGKLAGILIEALHQDGAWLVIIGIGVNVNMQPSNDTSTQVAQSVTSLAAETGSTVNRARIIMGLYRTLSGDMLRFLHDGWAGFAQEWKTVDRLAGQTVNVFEGGFSEHTTPWQGVAQGVDHLGRLQVEDTNGQIHAVLSGDVSVRLAF